ncbi:hypothetical protein GTR02_14370, partial [Kineococcus sp. R8]|uniref:hypothetical protein n=1 Tax=Kineococcus siccus TaxID=2696567 RepID=UPI00196B100D
PVPDPTTTRRTTTGATTARAPGAWLWALLAVAAGLNVLGSTGVLPFAVGIAGGLVTAGCVAGLVAGRVRRR